MFGLGPMELVIVFLIILLVFGAKRIPEIAQGIGKGITEFKKAANDITNEFDTNNPQQQKQQPSTYAKNELKGQQQEYRPQPPVNQPQETPAAQQPSQQPGQQENSSPQA